MVILIDLVRKYSFKSFTQYLRAVTNFIAKSISEQVSEVVDDDLRAIAALSTERIGHSDNLTGGFLLPKNQVAKVMQEGSADAELALWLYGNDVSNPNPRDMSGHTDKVIDRVGFPCVVKTNPLNNFNGRALAGLYQGIEDGLKISDNAAFQRAALASGLSISQWVYPLSDTPKPVIQEDQTLVKLVGGNDVVDCGNEATLWSGALTKFSWSCWFWIRGPITALSNMLFIDHASNVMGSFTAWLNGVDPKRINWRINEQATGISRDAYCITERSMIGRWVHVVGTFDNSLGSNNIKIYVDGILGAVSPTYNGTINLSAILTIGGPVNDFDGYIKDFRWWTTIPLTQSQVDALFIGDEANVPTPNYWLPMDEGSGNPIDAVTTTKTGVLTNGASWALFQPSKNYIWLDKVDDKFTILNHAAINNFTDFSVSFWYKPDDFGTSSTPNILSKNYANANSFILYHTFGTTALNYRVVNNAAVGTTVQAFVMTLGVWQHITATCEGANGLMKLYKNGVKVGEAYAGACANIGTVADLIWSANVSVKNEFGFKDFRIFRRVLGPDEIEAIYEGLGDWITPDQWFKVNEGELAPVSSIDGQNTIVRTTGGTWKQDADNLPNVQKTPVTIYSKKDDSLNHLAAFLDPIDRSVNIQLKKAGTFINKKSVGDNNVLWLDGINDYIALGAQTDLWANVSKTAFSFSIWINVYTMGDGYHYIFNHGWGSNYGFVVYINTANNAIVCEIAAVWPARVGTVTVNGAIPYTTQWLHIAFVYDASLGSANLKIYINGVLGNSGNGAATIAGNYVATLGTTGATTLKGYKKDFRWWNRAITATEILAVYQGLDDLSMLPDYHLPLDEGTGLTVYDSIKGKTATLTNGPAWRNVPIPWVIDLDGTNDTIDCGSSGILWSQSLTKFAFSFWFKADAYDATNNRWLLSHGGFTAQSFYVYMDGPAVQGRIVFIVRSAAGVAVSATANNINPNVWYHLTCVYDNSLGSANIKLYINGVAGATSGNLTEAINLNVSLFLAAAIDATNKVFDGKIKDFRFWTRTLSAAEALKLYNGTETYDMKPSYWLPMEDGTGNPIDIVNNFTATLTNGAAWLDTTIDTSLANMPTILYTKSRLSQYYYYAYDLNKFNFIVIVYNPTGDVFTIYRDGRLFNTANSAATIKGLEPKDNNMHLGYSGPQIPDVGNQYYNYAFRMFKFWKKQLTTVDVGWEQLNKMSISHLQRSEIPLAGFSTVTV